MLKLTDRQFAHVLAAIVVAGVFLFTLRTYSELARIPPDGSGYRSFVLAVYGLAVIFLVIFGVGMWRVWGTQPRQTDEGRTL